MRHIYPLLLIFSIIRLSAQTPNESRNIPLSEIKVPKMEITIPSVNDYVFAPTAFELYRPTYTSDPFIQNALYTLDFNEIAPIASWSSGSLSGYGSRFTFPGLMSNETGSIGITQQFGAVTLSGSISADKYGYYRGLQTTYGIHGSLSYRISNHLTLNIFGDYYTNSICHSPTTLPYIGTNRFGGYLGVEINEHIGLDIGAQQQYDPYSRSYIVVPIIRPYVNINEIPIGFDVGWLLKDLIGKTIYGDNFMRGNPTIAPPIEPLPPIR